MKKAAIVFCFLLALTGAAMLIWSASWFAISEFRYGGYQEMVKAYRGNEEIYQKQSEEYGGTAESYREIGKWATKQVPSKQKLNLAFVLGIIFVTAGVVAENIRTKEDKDNGG